MSLPPFHIKERTFAHSSLLQLIQVVKRVEGGPLFQYQVFHNLKQVFFQDCPASSSICFSITLMGFMPATFCMNVKISLLFSCDETKFFQIFALFAFCLWQDFFWFGRPCLVGV
ncbi:hypothetical protein CHARACLAT_017751 [Characodon lateralis]|uniref:Uncharacterized protein n=1 Tax=Characodon lateralis TaxID=208331 RepID=A0ABU7DTV1_9TELE|nr:hypothetical protein [Characodon lateralis]